jgi:hypothetical protein
VHDLVGLVIVSGAVCRELTLRDRHMLELLGPGDVVHAPVENGSPRRGGAVALTAVLDTELLVLHHLADRWGLITPDGTVLPLALSATGAARPDARPTYARRRESGEREGTAG